MWACGEKERPPNYLAQQHPGTGGGDGLGGQGGEPTVTTPEEPGGPVEFKLQAQAVATDPTRDVVYVSVGNGDAEYPNSLVALDASGVLWSTYVGSDPSALAVAKDGSKIYVELDGSDSIMPVSADGEAGEAFPVGHDQTYGPQAVVEMEVFPDDPNALLVVFYAEGISYAGGINIFDSGVPRRASVSHDWQLNEDEWHIDPTTAALGEPGKLYAYNGASTGFDLMDLDLTTAGPEITRVVGDVFGGFSVTLEYREGRLFGSNGQVVATDTLTLMGTFSAHGPTFVNEDGSNAYFAQTNDQGTWLLYACKTAQFTCEGATPIAPRDEEVSDLARFGEEGFAVLVRDESVRLWTSGAP